LTATLIYSSLAIERVIGAGQVNLIDIDANPAMVNKLVTDVNVPGEVDVVAITRNGKTFMPNSATVFQVGDLVHLFVLAGAQDKISKAFGS
jgi:trk system potassium uptake protein TrkA